jgi:hypothetical protein
MRCAAVLVLLTGCRAVFGLEPPQLTDAPAPDGPRIDASVDAPPLAKVCAADNNLVACFDFEGTVIDQAPSPNAIAVSNISFSNDGVNGAAILVDLASRMTIQESINLDIPSVTLEAWVYMTAVPGALSRSGVFDVNAQYGMFIKDGLVLSCTAGTPFEGGSVPLNKWTHIACTASAGQSFMYIDGVQVATAVYSGSLPTSSVDGGEIAGNNPNGNERFVGKLDVVRVYRVARSADQICKDAGKISCP